MIFRPIALVLCTLSALLLFAQTPEQSYFEWATMPFSKEELINRRSNLINILQRQGKEGTVLIPARDGVSHGETFRQLDDFYYFTGLELPNSILLINIDDRNVAVYAPVRDSRFESGSRPNDFPGMPLQTDQRIAQKSGLTIIEMDDFSKEMSELVKTNETIYINSGRLGPVPSTSPTYISYVSPIQILMRALKTYHPGLEYENIYGAIASVRMIKSEAEIALIRKAVSITVKGVKDAAKYIRPGISERYLEGVLEGSFKKNDAQRLSFGSIIKSGPNSLWPWRILATHYDRRNRIMEEGDLVIFDVGSEYQQYVSDVGRTFPVSGKFSERQKEILIMETKVADQIMEYIKPGITFNDLRSLSDQIIPEEAKQYMQVGLFYGHHLGLSTGDPNLANATLQPGMIFTVEPWYYNHDERISVFTEDVILVTENGCEVLSRALPRTPSQLELLMRH